jgi:hypothetical protein
VSSGNALESTQASRVALEMMARDLRSAGYGADEDYAGNPQPAIAYIDSMQVIVAENLNPYPDTSSHPYPPLAYSPAGSPRPHPLDGTSWQPPARYTTGAELVRYSLDVNNDGVVNASDLTDPNGQEAARTPNPNDYVLVRQVYGDSTGGVAHNNGGAQQHIALVRKPGSGVPPMFKVYMQGSSTPYDWSSGPIPVSQLKNIQRVEISVTATSPRADYRGAYAQTVLTTSVNSMRNSPVLGPPTYAVDGYVYNDANHNHTRDGGESGVAGALVRLGSTYTSYSSATGYFIINVPAGTYVLKHSPPTGFGSFTTPDSFTVTVPGPQTRSFADTARAGGWVHVTVFQDVNANGTQDYGEPGVVGVRTDLNTGSSVDYTGTGGTDSLFAGVGAYSVAITPPDSFVVTSTNPQTGTMTNGGSASKVFAMTKSATGHITGTVFRDNNRNATMDAGEGGIQNVWVGVTDDDGTNILGYAYSDANGAYSISVPINDPPHTKAYTVFCIPPSGMFPSGPISLGSIWVTTSSTIANKNFGMVTYQIITLQASRVLSLVSGNLIEKDWNGSDNQYATKGAGDQDILLGADAGGTDNVSVWFNQYPDSVFKISPTYTRNASQSVLSLALDTLDTGSPLVRPDLVTGTKKAAAGNLFVWLTQNTSGNLGYLPTTPSLSYTTHDAGDVTAVVTMDCAGGNMPDIIAGTKSPTAGNGTIEIFQNSNAASPVFAWQETYPAVGGLPGGKLGEVTCMQLADVTGDGNRDLIVGTKTGTYSGTIEVLRYNSKVNNARFISAGSFSTAGMAVTAITVLDLDGDGRLDIIAGVQNGVGSGHLQYWRNMGMTGNNITFSMVKQIDTPGLVLSLTCADFGAASGKDIAMGWRLNETSYVGGVLVYYTDLHTLPSNGVDPSNGQVMNMVPALNANNFNYGVQPSAPSPPYLIDLAAGVKVTALTGALVVFIR